MKPYYMVVYLWMSFLNIYIAPNPYPLHSRFTVWWKLKETQTEAQAQGFFHHVRPINLWLYSMWFFLFLSFLLHNYIYLRIYSFLLSLSHSFFSFFSAIRCFQFQRVQMGQHRSWCEWVWEKFWWPTYTLIFLLQNGVSVSFSVLDYASWIMGSTTFTWPPSLCCPSCLSCVCAHTQHNLIIIIISYSHLVFIQLKKK